MGRLLIPVVLLVVGGAVAVVWLLLKHFIARSRQRRLAMYAPELLRMEGLDPRVADIIIEQRTQLSTGSRLVRQLLEDPAVLIPTEYTNPLEQWLACNRKELQ